MDICGYEIRIIEKFIADDAIQGVQEFLNSEWAKKNRKRTFLDLGANIGAAAFVAAGNGFDSIICVEPALGVYGLLLENIVANDLTHKMCALPLAISGKSGDILSVNRTGPNSGQSSINWVSTFGVVNHTRTVSLRDCFNLFGDEQIDYVKMDIESGEWEAFKALEEDPEPLKRVQYMEVEMHPMPNGHEEIFGSAITEEEQRQWLHLFLKSCGFKVIFRERHQALICVK